ncbi:MAG: head decoration protein [Candidatus Omnitrophota bacterium]|nr:head decoration protein [Candidatus Omnitrophota bacterium]
MSSSTQSNTLADVLKWEESGNHSREAVTIASGENMAVNEVAGKITKSTPATGTAGGGNTGSGTCTSVTAGENAKIGTYTMTALSATSFAVKDPDGYALPDATVDSAYTNAHLNFTINDGSPDFIAGDSFTIAVAAGSGNIVPVDFSAVDGTQDAYGITCADYDASAAALAGVLVVRNAGIMPDDLVWPSGATAGQKAAALAQLKTAGIIETTEV